jgi:hypothetical protein
MIRACRMNEGTMNAYRTVGKPEAIRRCHVCVKVMLPTEMTGSIFVPFWVTSRPPGQPADISVRSILKLFLTCVT